MHSHQNRWKIAGTVQDSYDLERLCFRVVDDQVFRIRMYNPKANGQLGQIFPRTTGEWRDGKKIAGPKHCFCDSVAASGLCWLIKFQISTRSLTASGVNSYFSISLAADWIALVSVRLAWLALRRGRSIRRAVRRRTLRQSSFEYRHDSRPTRLPAHAA